MWPHTYDLQICYDYLKTLPKSPKPSDYRSLLQRVCPAKYKRNSTKHKNFQVIYFGIVLYAIKNNIFINRRQRNCASKYVQNMLWFHYTYNICMMPNTLREEFETLTTCQNMTEKEFKAQIATGALDI